jgi:hypothetical protein
MRLNKEFEMDEAEGNPKRNPTSRQLFEDAVADAQLLVAYAAGKCKKNIAKETIIPLINAKQYIDEAGPLDAVIESEFWLAYQEIWKLVKPVTAESLRANLSTEPRFLSRILTTFQPVSKWVNKNIPALFQWLSTRTTSKSRRTADRFIFFTLLILFIVLVLQIYWVIGNQLNAQLAELLKMETELSQEIKDNRDEYIAIEMRFKQSEWDSEIFKTNGVYTFYSSPDWERDILDNLSVKAELETDLASIKSQLERNSAVLMIWSHPWKRLIEKSVNGTKLVNLDQYDSQIKSINQEIEALNAQIRNDPDGSKKIREARNQMDILRKQLNELEKNEETNSDQILSVRSQLDKLTNWINQPGLGDQIVDQINQDIERLREEEATLQRQKQGDLNRETSRQTQLAAQFALVILQSYLLPLLYGILGAGTSVLRCLSKEIVNETYTDETGTQHLLRVSLGALAGILVGWFSFLIPNETTTFVGSISPFAIAFLVGYNIELFFAMMDRALFSITERLQQPTSTRAEESKSSSQSETAPPTGQTALGEAAG